MSFKRGGAGKKRDRNEGAIIEALRAIGAECWQVNGRGLPDLLVRHRGRVYGLEVKTGSGKQTDAQQITQWPVVRSVDDALSSIGFPRETREALSRRQKEIKR